MVGLRTPVDFVGIRNYVTILTDPAFHEALGHNAFIVVGSLVLQGPLALGLALLLNRKMRAQSLIRVLIFVPYVISEVVVGLGWGLMLQSGGALNGALEKIGLGALRADWISDPALAIWTLLIIITWKYIGFAVILFLAGLQGIPEELSEAAAIDGASYWQIQRHIVLPLMGPTIRIWAFLSIIGSLQLFDLVWIIWGQYVASTAGTSTMATYMVANGRNAGSFGYGSAVAVVMFLISLAVALVYQRFVLRRDTAGALTGGTNDRYRHARGPQGPALVAALPRRGEALHLGARRLRRPAADRHDAGPRGLHHPRRLPLERRDHRRPAGFPTTWNWQNYADVLGSPIFWGQVGNSAIAAIATTVFVVALGLMAAYALARYRFRGRGAVFALFTAGLMFPMTVAITPLYILVRNLGLMNSLAGVIVPQIAFAPAADDHHPVAVPRGDPERATGGRLD